MSAASVLAEYSQSSLHLYRSLLRQCTYLPDSIARREIKKQVLARFRGHKTAGDDAAARRISTEEWRARISRRLKTGLQALRTLENANAGGASSLGLVLRHAYGRTGKRRHELMQALLAPVHTPKTLALTSNRDLKQTKSSNPWDVTTVAIPDIFEAIRNESKNTIEYHIRPEYECLKAIIIAQTRTNSHMHQRNIKEHVRSTPAINTWHRSMPRTRVKNIAIQHYAHLIERVLPPLPDEEWARLDEIARGLHSEPIPQRRTPIGIQKPVYLKQEHLGTLVNAFSLRDSNDLAQSGHRHATPNVLADLRFRDTNALWLHDKGSVGAAKEDVLAEEMLLRPSFAVLRNTLNNPHVMSPRHVRRHLAAVFRECPRVTWNEQKCRWIVEWGTKSSQRKSVATPQLSMLFKRLKDNS